MSVAAELATTDRFHTPLYTVAEAARYLGVPESTFHTWAMGYNRKPPGRPAVHGAPLVTVIEGQPRGYASLPFVGLAEGLVLAGIRQLRVPMQRIRPALDVLQKELGLEHVLASQSLYTDGIDILFDYAKRTGDTDEARAARQLVVVRDGQRVFNEVVDQYLHRVQFADNYAQVIPLPGFGHADVVADPRRGFGQPTFERGGAKVEDVISLFLAGEKLIDVSAEYGVPMNELEDALRVAASRHAA